MKIIDRLDCAVTRAQLAAMGTIRDASQYLRTDPDRSDPSTQRDPEEGATTVEYAIGTIAPQDSPACSSSSSSPTR